MTPAQAQYGTFGQDLPNTGFNLGLALTLSLGFLAVGIIAVCYLGKGVDPHDAP